MLELEEVELMLELEEIELTLDEELVVSGVLLSEPPQAVNASAHKKLNVSRIDLILKLRVTINVRN